MPGVVAEIFIYLDGMLLANVKSGDSAESIYYYHVDHLGTPQKMTDAAGTIVWAADYKPFGQVDITINQIENNFRFAGQYFDAETGLHYNYHRYYDPKTGRYLTPDPFGLNGGINLYAYTENNPINLVDPFGLEALSLPDNRGVNGMYNTGFYDRSPDYYAFVFSLGDVGMTIEYDHYGRLYVTMLGGADADYPIKNAKIYGASVMAGWLDECSEKRPDKEELRNFLTEWSGNVSAGFLWGGGYTFAGDKRAFDTGIMTPQISFSEAYSTKFGY